MAKSKTQTPRVSATKRRDAAVAAEQQQRAASKTGRALTAAKHGKAKAGTKAGTKAERDKEAEATDRGQRHGRFDYDRDHVANPPAKTAEDQPAAVARGVKKAEDTQAAADMLGAGQFATNARERAKVETARARRASGTAVAAAINKAQPERMSRSAARRLDTAEYETHEAETAALRRRVRELENAQGRPGGSDDADLESYPRVKYRKHAIDAKHPNGYEVRRVADEDEEARLGKGWGDSPDDVDL